MQGQSHPTIRSLTIGCRKSLVRKFIRSGCRFDEAWKEEELVICRMGQNRKADGNGEVSTHSTPTQGSPTFSRTTLGAAIPDANLQRLFGFPKENLEIKFYKETDVRAAESSYCLPKKRLVPFPAVRPLFS